jgi:7-cyano-7-deazaguanine reductase
VSDASAFHALGKRSEHRYENPDASVLEVFDNPHPSQNWAVSLACEEFTSLCPVTGQPDFGRLHIAYVPSKLCVESKSLKLYLMRYRNHGTFHEDCVNAVASHLAERLSPRYLVVYGDFRPRGGIAIRPLAVRKASDLGPEDELRCMGLLSQLAQLSSGHWPGAFSTSASSWGFP